jgi:hypothetical protein
MTLDEAVKGTFLEKVAEVLASGQFIEPEYDVPAGAKVIGEATPLEKALVTAINQLAKKVIEKIKTSDYYCTCKTIHDPKKCKATLPPPQFIVELKAIEAEKDTFKKIVGKLIKDRLHSGEFTIYKGFKIVATPTDPMVIFFDDPNDDGSNQNNGHKC